MTRQHQARETTSAGLGQSPGFRELRERTVQLEDGLRAQGARIAELEDALSGFALEADCEHAEIPSETHDPVTPTVSGDIQRNAALRTARRRMLSSGGLTDDERRFLGQVPQPQPRAGSMPERVDLTHDEKQLLRRVSLHVHHADDMYPLGNPGHYLLVGLSAIRCIQQALAASGRTDPMGMILDFPCGYGRVLRFLKEKYRNSEILAGDLDIAALSFCRQEFSVPGILSNQSLIGLSLPQKFDLIWCGSLITHIQERDSARLLRFFYEHLSDQGVCVFSTHGQRSVDRLKNGERGYGLTQEGQSIALRGFGENGYGYADYPGREGYGISVVSHARMVEIAKGVGEWNEVSYQVHGWYDHHDVYAFAIRAMARASR